MQKDSIYITIDVDWACDEVLGHTIDFLEENEMKATFFVTHDTPLLNRLRESSLFELGIHPNFQYLLNGTSEFHNMEEVLEHILEIVPEAVSVRCHSLVQSSPLLDLFQSKGLKYDVNLFIPWESGIELRPIRHWNGMLRVPYCWEDDGACISGNWITKDQLSELKGLKVINFHPIHLYLNTERLERYEIARAYLSNPKRLKQMAFTGTQKSAFSELQEVISYIHVCGGRVQPKCIKEIEGDIA